MTNYSHVVGVGDALWLEPSCPHLVFIFYTPEVQNQLAESLANRAKTIFVRHRRPPATVPPQESALKISSQRYFKALQAAHHRRTR